MGTLLYLPNGIQSSPYSHLLDPTLWLDIHDVFTREACTLFGLSVDSPLSVWYVVPSFFILSNKNKYINDKNSYNVMFLALTQDALLYQHF